MADPAELIELRRQTKMMFDDKIKKSALAYTALGTFLGIGIGISIGAPYAPLFIFSGPFIGYACGRAIARKRFLG